MQIRLFEKVSAKLFLFLSNVTLKLEIKQDEVKQAKRLPQAFRACEITKNIVLLISLTRKFLKSFCT